MYIRQESRLVVNETRLHRLFGEEARIEFVVHSRVYDPNDTSPAALEKILSGRWFFRRDPAREYHLIKGKDLEARNESFWVPVFEVVKTEPVDQLLVVSRPRPPAIVDPFRELKILW